MAYFVCHACGKTDRIGAFESGFCPQCLHSVGEPLTALYDWMDEQYAQLKAAPDLFRLQLLLSTYRDTLAEITKRQNELLYPEFFSNRALRAEEQFNNLNICSHRQAAVCADHVQSLLRLFCQMDEQFRIDALPAQDIRLYYCRLKELFYLQKAGFFSSDIDYAACEQLAVRRLKESDPTAPPLSEDDDAFGPPPRERVNECLKFIFQSLYT